MVEQQIFAYDYKCEFLHNKSLKLKHEAETRNIHKIKECTVVKDETQIMHPSVL